MLNCYGFSVKSKVENMKVNASFPKWHPPPGLQITINSMGHYNYLEVCFLSRMLPLRSTKLLSNTGNITPIVYQKLNKRKILDY